MCLNGDSAKNIVLTLQKLRSGEGWTDEHDFFHLIVKPSSWLALEEGIKKQFYYLPCKCSNEGGCNQSDLQHWIITISTRAESYFN